MEELTKLFNIGKTLSEKLNKIGICNLQDLKDYGSEQAIIKISTIEDGGLALICSMH